MAKNKKKKSVLIRKKNQMYAFGATQQDALANLKVLFPQSTIYKTKQGNFKVEYKPNFKTHFNANLNKEQAFLDNKVIIELQKYVSKKYGVQEQSIRYGSYAGSGKVHINVPYAEIQAYSPRIRKRVGLRGTKPWERMVADKKDIILKQVAEYSKGLNA